jgi:hypothetical protein
LIKVVARFSVRAIENLVASPWTYRFTSDEFSSRYGKIRFDRVIASFDTLHGWLDEEAERVFGAERWHSRVRRASTGGEGSGLFGA